MNKRFLLLCSVILAAIVGTTGAYVLYHEWYIMDTYEGEIFFRVTDTGNIGFAADTDLLHFGTVPHGGISRREIILKSDAPAVVYLAVDEGIAEWVFLPNNTVYLDEQEVRMKVEVRVSEYAVPGNYTGTFRATYVRRFPWS